MKNYYVKIKLLFIANSASSKLQVITSESSSTFAKKLIFVV